ncbi:WD40-repeat-containing domain protein [Endogone sp. FLAS-F59071]|nr:WD40-repeat-containing domain protein [Endogone sp. FLAS-F59071]|eukprot:RUS16393.1 WD40-repeat-containing domain protein [Endogone sp. FLAS-F59071]
MTKKMASERRSVGIRTTSDQATSEEAVQKATFFLNKVSGGFLSNYPVEFTKDSNYFFCCASTCIKIYSVATGEIVRTLSSSPNEGGHSNLVTCVMLNPKNALQLLSASLDGTVKLWDFNDSILLKTYQLGVPVTHMTIHASNPKFIYIVTNKVSTNKMSTKKMSRKKVSTEKEEQNMATKSDGDKINSVLLRFSLEAETLELIRMLKTRQCTGLQISHDGSFLSLASRYKLHVWKVDHEARDFEFKTYISQERITCLAFHPTEACIATGDRLGRITLWYCFSPTKIDRPVTSKLHWHAHKVNHLAFTADGVYLLSGGEEAVLVLWQLETGHKQFLPRLGSEIRSITVSPDQNLYALGHLDNSIRIVSALNLELRQSVQGLKYAQTDHNANPLSTGLVIEPRNHHVVLNGVPGTLQFYNAYTDRHALELEVASRNMISRTDDKEIVQPHVDFVAFWDHGEWMATVDSRDDGLTTPELYLKFWWWDPDAQSYTLNTRVDAPHTEPITSLAFHPGSARGAQPMAITTSCDKNFKIWQLVMQPGVGKNNVEVSEPAWACRSVGVYRDYVPHHAAFSEDGSILAVAYGQIVTLWDPYTNTFQGVLVHPPENRAVKRVEFLGRNSPFLVSVTQDHLYVWNLLTCKDASLVELSDQG